MPLPSTLKAYLPLIQKMNTLNYGLVAPGDKHYYDDVLLYGYLDTDKALIHVRTFVTGTYYSFCSYAYEGLENTGQIHLGLVDRICLRFRMGYKALWLQDRPEHLVRSDKAWKAFLDAEKSILEDR